MVFNELRFVTMSELLDGMLDNKADYVI